MLVKTIENKEADTKWEIYKISEDNYSCVYFERCGSRWTALFPAETGYTKDAIEFEFDTEVA